LLFPDYPAFLGSAGKVGTSTNFFEGIEPWSKLDRPALDYHHYMNLDLFGEEDRLYQWREELYPGAVVLRRYAVAQDSALLESVESVVAVSPWREAFTPNRLKMSVLVTGCGKYGMANVGDYRMRTIDPVTGMAWPPMPTRYFASWVSTRRPRQALPAFYRTWCISTGTSLGQNWGCIRTAVKMTP
jgi:hypothetical protein